MTTQRHYRVVILGSGPAGLTAAVYASRAELAVAAAGALTALRRGDVTEWRRARAFLQSKIGHLR